MLPSVSQQKPGQHSYTASGLAAQIQEDLENSDLILVHPPGFPCGSDPAPDHRGEGLLTELPPVESPYSGSPGHERGIEPMSLGFIKNALVFPVPDYSR